LLFFVVMALYYVSPRQMETNWHPFQPNGWAGTLTGAAVVFFAYIGFDAVSTVAEETRNPSRDLPIGILASLVVCTILYIVVAAVFTGILPYPELVRRLSSEQAEPLTMALQHVAPHAVWAAGIVAFGSVVAHTAVLLVFQLGQPRIFFSMARDGLLPEAFARVHPRFRTPHVTTIWTGVIVGLLSGITTIDEMVDLSNIGTLFAFVLVCVGIPILRVRDPQRRRPFRVPFGAWLFPVLGTVSCLFLMYYLPPSSWWRFFGWLMLGMAVYSAYGQSHSALARATAGGVVAVPSAASRLAARIACGGFLLAAFGQFVMPHRVRVHMVLTTIADPAAPEHAKALWGFVLTLVGVAIGVAGLRRALGGR